MSIELLKKRIMFLKSNPKYALDYFSNKIQTTWINPTFQTTWCSIPSILLDSLPEYNNYIASKKLIISILTGTAFKFEERIFDIYQINIYIFAGIGLLYTFKMNHKNNTIEKQQSLLISLIFLGRICFSYYLGN